MRLWALAMAVALVASCGESDPKAGESNAATGEVTVSLPPALPALAPEPAAPAQPPEPVEPEATPPTEPPAPAVKEKPKAPAPAAATPKPVAEPPAETAEPEAEPAEPSTTPAEPDALPETSPPIAAEGLAGYIRRAGFQCDRVTATRRAAGGGPYKFDCAAGGSYRGTMRRGRLYFRPWSDRR